MPDHTYYSALGEESGRAAAQLIDELVREKSARRLLAEKLEENLRLDAERQRLVARVETLEERIAHLESIPDKQKTIRLQGKMLDLQSYRDICDDTIPTFKARLSRLDALLASECPPPGLEEALDLEHSPTSQNAFNAWRWFREQLGAGEI